MNYIQIAEGDDGMHYPIYGPSYHYEKEDAFRYVSVFRKHVYSKAIPYTYIDNGRFFTEHSYDDGLIIQLFWKQKEPFDLNQLNELNGLEKNNSADKIELMGYNFMFYSTRTKSPRLINEELERKFKEEVLFGKEKIRLSRKEYFAMEYQLSERVWMDDKEFKQINQEIGNIVGFEQYYQQRKEKIQ